MSEEPTRIKRLKVSVTQTEIDEAVQAKSDKCMIHEAIKRDHPEFRNIWVDKNQVRVTDPKQNVIYTFQMAPLGRIGLLKFDMGEPLVPFSFTLVNPIVRERRFRDGAQRADSSKDSSTKSLGAVPKPKDKESRTQSGRDRVFGQKVWANEMAKVRELLAIPAAQ